MNSQFRGYTIVNETFRSVNNDVTNDVDYITIFCY